jgi:hypothetical protein
MGPGFFRARLSLLAFIEFIQSEGRPALSQLRVRPLLPLYRSLACAYDR